MSGGSGKCVICKLVGLLVGIGGINWGLVGVWNVNLVDNLLGAGSTASRIVYALVGLAGILALLSVVKCCPCQKGSCETKK